MPFYIDIECPKCQKKFKIDGSAYANKKISFSCKNCGNKISHFVPPGIDGLYAPKSEIATSKVKKVKETAIKEPKINLPAENVKDTHNSDGLKLKMPSLFKKKAAEPQNENAILNETPISGMDQTNLPPMPAGDVVLSSFDAKNGLPQTEMPLKPDRQKKSQIQPKKSTSDNLYLSAKVAEFETPEGSAEPDFLLSRQKNAKPLQSGKIENDQESSRSMMHIPKPGMPFIAQISTPSFYKAGSSKRKDYSFIITELSKFRHNIGRPSVQDSLASYRKAAMIVEEEKDYTEQDFTAIKEERIQVESVPSAEVAYTAAPAAQQPVLPQVEPVMEVIEEPVMDMQSSPINEEGFQQQPAMQETAASAIQHPDLTQETPFIHQTIQKEPEEATFFIPLGTKSSGIGTVDKNQDSGKAAPGRMIDLENLNSLPVVEVVEDNFTSVMQPASTEQRIPIPADFTAQGQEQGFRIPPAPQAAESAPQIEQTPAINPPFAMPAHITNNQAGFIQPQQVIQPQVQFNQPLNQPPVNQHTQYQAPIAAPFQKQQPQFYQPQYGTPQINPNVTYPEQAPELMATVKMPPYRPQPAAAPGIPQNPPVPMQPQIPFQGLPGNINPLPQPFNAAAYPQMNQPGAYIPAVQPQSAVPPQGNIPAPVIPAPPEPIPPPSVTAPMQASTLKKPAVEDDEEEEFGPSNFGLDF